MEQAILQLLSPRTGHFLMESGHHGGRWLGLELLCRHPSAVEPLANALAERLAPLQVDSICGPLVEGAFVALMVATRLGCAFSYSQRFARPGATGLFPAGYRVPQMLRAGLCGQRIAIVNDVINAGSAVKGTFADLTACGAQVVAIASLLVLGDAAGRFAAEKQVALLCLAQMPNNLWTPETCPLCAAGVPLEDVDGFVKEFQQPHVKCD